MSYEIIHRKVDGEKECICGSKLKRTNKGFVCIKQEKLGEPSRREL